MLICSEKIKHVRGLSRMLWPKNSDADTLGAIVYRRNINIYSFPSSFSCSFPEDRQNRPWLVFSKPSIILRPFGYVFNIEVTSRVANPPKNL